MQRLTVWKSERKTPFVRVPFLFLASFVAAIIAGLLIGVVRGLAAKELPVSGLWVAFLTPNAIGLVAVFQDSGTGTEPVAFVSFAIWATALVSASFGITVILGLLISVPFRRQHPPASKSTTDGVLSR